MTDVAGNKSIAKERGYEMIDQFTLPVSAWLLPYYQPLEARLGGLRKKYEGDEERLEILDRVQTEIDMYRRFSSFYGYVFYLLRKPESAG